LENSRNCALITKNKEVGEGNFLNAHPFRERERERERERVEKYINKLSIHFKERDLGTFAKDHNPN